MPSPDEMRIFTIAGRGVQAALDEVGKVTNDAPLDPSDLAGVAVYMAARIGICCEVSGLTREDFLQLVRQAMSGMAVLPRSKGGVS